MKANFTNNKHIKITCKAAAIYALSHQWQHSWKRAKCI